MRQRLYITSTGTGIGKTFITAALARQAKANGQKVAVYKPVVTGFDAAHIEESDTGILLQALDLPPTPENIERISPWRYVAPLAPSMAARQENRSLDFDALIAHSKKIMKGPENLILIEGIGGVMAPLTDQHTVLDWIAALDIPVLLVAGTYLGSLSHTLTALEILKQHRVSVYSIIVNESEITVPGTLDELKRWTDVPLMQIQQNDPQLLMSLFEILRK